MLTHTTEHALIHDALLLEATRLLAKASSPAQKIAGMLRLLSEWADLPFGRVLLPDYSAGALRVVYSYGLDPQRVRRGDYNVPFDQGLTGAVWRSGQAALVTDVTSEPIFITRIAEPIGETKRGVGFISVPIVAEDHPIGVLSVQRPLDQARRYSQDVDLLRIAAALIGPVLLLKREHDVTAPAREPGDEDHERLRLLCAAHGIIGTSPALLAAVKRIDNAKSSDAPILLLGESGTGKEMFAAMAHQLSRRRAGPYVPLNCAAIPDQLLESELFGHEKGSFTGAYKNKKGKLQQAHGGSLFLDEIGDMPMDLQVKLLRVLQDRCVEPVGGDRPVPVDFRIITATHVNLKQAIAATRFRLDLFFRLNVIPVSLPPLRERQSDIPLLAEHFRARYQGMYRRSLNFGAGVMERLQAWPWPGNIRQLQNVIERAVLQAEGPWINATQVERMLADESGLPVGTAASAEVLAPGPVREEPVRYRPYARVDVSQRERILAALRQTGGNQTQAAALLGFTTRQLRYRLAKLAQG